MNLAETICNMAKYLDEESIAKAVGVPLKIIQGLLTGEIPNEAIDQYDPAKPPEIRVVEQTKYHRSKIIGFVSSGGCGASTISAALTLSLKKYPVLAVDLNEYANLSNLLAKKKPGLTPTALGWARGSNIDFIITPNMNYDLILGVSNIHEYLMSMPTKMASLIREASKRYEYLIVDCPGIPYLWEEVFKELDLIIWVNRTDPASLHSLQHLENLISPFKNKTMVLFNMAQKGRHRATTQKMGFLTVADIPYFKKDILINTERCIKPLVEIIIGKQVRG